MHHLDAVAGKADHPLDQDGGGVAWLPEDHHVAARRHLAEQPRFGRGSQAIRQGPAAVAIGEFGAQQRVADLQGRLHRAGGNIKGLGHGGGGADREQDGGQGLHQPVDQAAGEGMFAHGAIVGAATGAGKWFSR